MHKESLDKKRMINSDGNKFWRTLIALIIAVALILPESSLAKEGLPPTDIMFSRINKVWSFYEKRQYKKARKSLDRIMADIEADPDHGDQYPHSVFYELKTVDAHLNDKMGTYRSCPKFTGIVTEKYYSMRGGMIVVKRGKIKKDFIYDMGTILKGDFDKGTRVTVYYNDTIEDHAVKILSIRNIRRSNK